MRQMNALGLRVLKSFESCRLKAYWDKTGKVFTIGWGDTGPDVVEGLEISEGEAEKRLAAKLATFCAKVEQYVKVDITDDQFSALVDFAYNAGAANLKGSTLLAKLNAGNSDVSSEFERWHFSGGVSLNGLIERRKAEAALFRGDEAAVEEILAARKG